MIIRVAKRPAAETLENRRVAKKRRPTSHQDARKDQGAIHMTWPRSVRVTTITPLGSLRGIAGLHCAPASEFPEPSQRVDQETGTGQVETNLTVQRRREMIPNDPAEKGSFGPGTTALGEVPRRGRRDPGALARSRQTSVRPDLNGDN